MDSFEKMRAKESSINPDLLREFLSYQSKTGIITWIKVNSNRVSVGDHAGSIKFVNKSRKQYRTIYFFGVNLQYHRVAWFLFYGSWPENQIDHEDGNGLNNQIRNLLDVTRSRQQKNVKLSVNNTSGFSGVMFSKQSQKWIAVIVVDGKRIHLGSYSDFQDACRARKSANRKYGFGKSHGRTG